MYYLFDQIIDAESIDLTTSPNEILILTPERASSARVFQSLQELDQRGELGSIWFDEAQSVLTFASIRPCMSALIRRTAIFKASSRCFLTATLPPSGEHALRMQCELGTLQVVRNSTNRSEIHYLKHECKDGTMLPTALKLAAKVCHSNSSI